MLKTYHNGKNGPERWGYPTFTRNCFHSGTGSVGDLADQGAEHLSTNPMNNNKDHLVGQLTTSTLAPTEPLTELSQNEIGPQSSSLRQSCN